MILRRASWRYLWRHPWLVGLSVLGVALGVAVVIAVDLANESARRAFAASVESLAGRATHQIVGGPQGLSDTFYQRLRVTAGVRDSAPVVEGYAKALEFPGLTFRILGIDPFAEGRFRPYVGGRSEPVELGRLLTEPATALLAKDTARRLGIESGATIALRIGAARQTITIVGLLVIEDPVARQALASVLITDIATAQELLGMHGQLSRIDLIVPDGAANRLKRIRALLPANGAIVTAADRSHALDQMTRAFRINLTALSLLALLVGMFLIYNIMTFSMLQRRALIGTLRALGVTRRKLFVHVIAEALVIGFIGSALGAIFGVVLAKGLVERVVQTINDLYFVLSVGTTSLATSSLLKGFALGLGAAVVAALVPAWEATRTEVATALRRSVIEARSRGRAPRAALYGVALAALGTLVLLIPTRSLLVSYAGLFIVVVAFALIVPIATLTLMRLLQSLIGRTLGVTGRLAARGVSAALSRTGVAITALAVAVSATVGVGVMVESFRQSFLDWLVATVRADVYVAAPVIETAPAAPTLDTELVTRLAAAPGVAAVSTGRRVRLDGPDGVTQLFILQTDEKNFGSYQFKEGNTQTAWTALQGSDAVVVSEPYAYRHRLRVGDEIELRTDSGLHPFTVAGIYYDYGSDVGRVTMSRRIYEHYWKDRGITSLGIYASPGTDVSDLLARLHRRAGDHEVMIRSNQALRTASLEVFDRTFAVTAVLRLLATVVAFIGVLSALMALQLERGRELAVLRAIGLTPSQLWRLLTTETGLMGFTAGALAIPLGVGMALALILVINRRSFGWSLQLSLDPAILLQGLGLAVIAALLAGLYPALRMAWSAPAPALREE
ncbi:MAG: FtsX-like permease family protein [Acidiferrobacterales bacterium]